MSDTLYAPPGTEEFDWPPRGRSAMGAAPRVSPLQSAMQQRQEQRDLYDPTKFVPAEGAVPLTGAPVHKPGAWGDFRKHLWSSTVQLGEELLGAVSIANRALGGDPDMLRIIESTKHSVGEYARSIVEEMSPEAQAAARSSLFGGTDRRGNATPSPGEVGWGNYISATVASTIPTVVAAVLPGGVIRNAIGAGVATAGLFGAIQAGGAYNAFVDAVDNAKESDFAGHPVYQELRQRGLSDTDARKELVGMIAPSLAAIQFGIGAATGVGYAHMFGGGITGSLARRAGIGAAEGAALGALQGAGGNLASQRAEVQAGVLSDYNPTDAALQGAAGAIGGVLLGGGAGAIAGRRRSALKDGPSHPVEVPADQAAALAEVGAVEAPRPAPQGEMFLPYEMGAGPRPGEAAGMPTRQPDLFGGPEIQVTEQAPAFPQPTVRMTGEPQAGMPPAQREMFPSAVEQRVPQVPEAVPPEMRQPPPEAPGQMDLPLQPRATEPQPVPPAAPEVPPEMRVRPGEIPGAPVSPIPTPASPATTSPSVVRVEGYGGPNADRIANRIEHLMRIEADAGQTETARSQAAERIREFTEYRSLRDAQLAAAKVPQEFRAAILTLEPGATVVGRLDDGTRATGLVDGFGVGGTRRNPHAIVGIVDSNGFYHDIRPENVVLASGSTPARAPRKRATEAAPPAARPQEPVVSPQPTPPSAPAAPAPATRRPSVAPEQGATPTETTTVVAPKKPRTPEVIRRWAEGTTVKADDGEPLRVYHGTKSDIREFDASKRGAHTKAGSAEEAFFFTDHPGVAGEYADKAPVVGNPEYRKLRSEYEAALQRFKDAQKKGVSDAELAPMRAELLRMAGQVNVGGAGPNVVAAYLRLKNPLTIDYTGKHTATAGEGFAEIVKRAKAAGHDGVFFKNVDDTITSGRRSNVYAVFDAENIRSAMDLRERPVKTPEPTKAAPAPEPAKPQTLGDKLRAKRAAEKARMAATGERQRGRVESVGEEFYHSGPEKIVSLDVERGDIGVHVGTRDQADHVGGQLHAVQFEPKKPLRAEEPEYGGWSNPISAMAAIQKAGVNVPEAVRKQVEAWDKTTTVVARGNEMTPAQRRLLGMLRRVVQHAGYDSIVYRNAHEGRERADSYIVLDTTGTSVRHVGEAKARALAPAAPTFDREAARSAVAKEIVPLKNGADTTRAMNKMLDEIEGLLALKTQDGAPVHPSLQGALREWVRSKNVEVPIPGQVKNGKPIMKTVNRLPGIETTPGELADKISRAVEGRALVDTAENRVAARQEVRQPSVVENERIAKKAASEEATGDNLAADDYAVTKQDFAESEAAARGEDAPAEEDASTGVQVYKPELAAERVSTKNTERVAADLLYELRQGLKSPEEAAVEYGGPAETGRKRTSAEFVDYLEKQIAHYGDPKTVEAVMRDLAEAEKKRLANRGDVKSKQDDTAAVQRLLREYEMTSADSLDMLRAAAKKLRDADTRAEVAAEIATKQAEKKAEKKALADEAKQVGVSAATMQKLRQMVSTAERQADVKAMLAVEDLTRRSGFTMTDLAKQMGYDPQAWLAEHQHRMLGKGEPDAERARMYDAVFETSNRRMEELDGEREKLARYYGSDMARVEKAQERLDVPDQHLARAYQWLAENYGDTRTSAYIKPYMDIAAKPELANSVNRLLREAESGHRLGLHELLRKVELDPNLADPARGLVRLARILSRKVPDLDVLSRRQLADRGIRSQILDKAVGAYSWHPETGGVVMMEPHDTSHVTAVHEALHAQADHFIRSNPDSPEVLALERIRQELRGLDAVDVFRDSYGGKKGRIEYTMENAHETLTMMMTDPTVQGFMAKTKASGQLIEDMRALGIDPTVGRPSMWNVFVDWVKKIVGIDPHKDGVTMLDYAMRVGLRTIRAADEWNAITPEVWKGRGGTALAANKISPNIRVPDDPVGRELAFSARGAVNRVVSASDLVGMGDKARAAVLQAATTDSIVEWNRKLAEPSDRLGVKGNPLVRLRDALENITGVARRYHEQHADTVEVLADRLRSKTGQDVAQLMNDATLAEVRLGTRDEAANAHLKTPEQQARLAELRDRYDGLSDEAKQLYKDTRAHYETTYRAERKARLNALVDAVMPDATEDQRKAILSALRTRAGTEALLTDKSTGVEAAFGNDWQAHRALVRGVAQVHKMGFVSGDYFPLRRFGDYVVRYGSGEEGNYGVEMFERRSEAEARRAELAAQGVDDLSQVMDRRESKLRDLLPGSSIPDEIERAVAKNPRLRDQASVVREVVDQVLLEHATRSERVRTQFRRKGVQGATVDPSRVLATEFLAAGYRMGHIQHGFERGRALADLQLVVDDLGRHGAAGEQIRLSQVKKELEQRVATGDDAGTVLAGAARRATQIGYIQSLMSPSHMVTNTVGAWANAVPLIGARHGAVAASAQLARASAQVAPKVLGQGARNFLNALGKGLKAADWRMSHLARDRFIAAGADRGHMTKLFEALDHVGLIDHTQDRELQNIANPTRLSTTGVGKLWQRFMDLNAAGAHAVDVMNKSAIAKAAFDLEFRRSKDVQGAVDYAMETLRQAHPNYNLSNRSRIATNKGSLGQAGAPLMQFKAYGFHMYGVLANLTKASMHGATTEQRREARLALAGIIATHAAAAGVVNTIADPLRYIGGAYDFVTSSRPRDYQADVRNFIADIFGPELGEVISRGLPRAAGIDLSNRVGLGNMLAVPELTSFDAKGVVNMVGLAALGAGGQDAAEIGMGIGAMLRGDVTEGLKLMAPRVLRDAMKAHSLSERGATSGRNNQVIIPAEQLTMKDILSQAVGFQPARVAEAREARNAVSSRMMEARERRTKLATRWLEADPADRSGLMDDIREWNRANPGFTLTVAQLLQMQKDRGKAAKTDYGLRVPPKAGYLRERARFANVEQ